MSKTSPRFQQWNERSNASGSPLRDAESMFRILFERSADAMSLFDPELGRFIESNEAVARHIGAPSIEALGNASPAEISPERQPDGRFSDEKAAEMVKRALEAGSHRFEWMSRRYDGSEMPIEVVLTAIPFQGRTLLLAVSRDISARKKVEREILELNVSLEQRVFQRTAELIRANQQLKAAEQEMRTRAAQMQKHRDALLELAQLDKSDLGGSLQQICALAAAALGVERVSYWSLHESDTVLVRERLYLHDSKGFEEEAEGRRLTRSECPAYFEALAARRPFVANRVLENPATRGLADNYLKPLGIVSMLDAPVWLRGKVVGVLCHEHTGPAREWSAEEIDFVSALATMVSLALEESSRVQSERRLRESEARFSTAFRASPVLITISRMSDARFVEANDAFVEWIGLERDQIVGRNSQDLGMWLDEGERGRFLGELQRTRSVRDVECHLRSRRGSAHSMLVSADIIEVGGEPHMLVFGLDITQRKQAEAELLKTLAREKELGQLRSKFVSMVSHEFRTPLGIIQSSAEILDEYFGQLEPAERQEHLQSIQRNTRRMAGLMEEVLLISGIEAGKMEFKPGPIDPRAFLNRLVDEVHSATDRRCPIELVLSDVPAQAQGDERLLRHIFTNLLTNAVKYSEPGCPVQFEIGCDGAAISATVRDRGIGIPEAEQEWLFSAFHRASNVGDRPGTGLGLVIVKRCVELHGGKITIESKAGEGTTVTVRLPRLPGEADTADGSAGL